jgi:hypothetical protein
MTATLPPPRLNRVAGYLNPSPPIPKTPQEKQDAWGDALFAAAMFYQNLLSHPDLAVAERAARAIFDLEKTRLRHGRELAGATIEPAKPHGSAKSEEYFGDRPWLDDLEPLEPIKPTPKTSPQKPKLATPTPAVPVPKVEPRNEKPASDEELLEEFAKTEYFDETVRAMTRLLRNAGQDHSPAVAQKAAKELLLPEIRKSRVCDDGPGNIHGSRT